MVAQGTTLAGRYRLDVRLGAGGMGEVWRGEDTVLARTVAVKVLLPGRLDDPGFAVRFQGEARAMATVNHPGVVDVYDYGVTEVPGDGPTAYLVMRFVDGEPLDRLLARLGRIGADAAMELIAQAASALQAVHDQGIVHRDVKPGNLLVRPDGTLVLTDFGIARADAGSRLTDAGMVLGTAAYCAPEQAEGASATPAVDVYALGVVAYECLAGRRPFDGDSPVTIALKHIREQVPPLPPDVPPEVRFVVERALSKDPARRWPSAAALSQAARQAMRPAGTAGQEYGRTGMVAALDLGARSVDQSIEDEAARETGHLTDTYTYRITRETWQVNPPEAPQSTRATRGARQRSRSRRKGPIVAGLVGSAALAGLVAAGVNLTSAGSRSPVTTPSPPAVRFTLPMVQSPSATTTWLRVSPTPSRKLRPTNRPSRSPSPTPTPSRTATPSPSPSPSASANLIKVPSVKDLKEAPAKSLLTQLGFVVSTRYYGSGPCSGKVLGQSPKAGTLRPKGSAVVIQVPKHSCPPSPTPTSAPTSAPTPTPTPSPSPSASPTP